MSSDQYQGYNHSGNRQSSGLLLGLLDLLITIISLAVAILMIVTYLVPFINPAHAWFLPALGLAAPALYIATVILTLYWIIRWKWLKAGVMLAIVVCGIFQVSLFWNPEFRRDYGQELSDRSAFKVMTYNVRQFYGEKGQSSVKNVLQLIQQEDPDVICLQEFNARLTEGEMEYALLEEKYESAVFGRTQAPDSLYGAPLLILSKYHIIRSGVVLTPAISVWADLQLGDDTVRVFNNHLRSTAIKAADNDYITSRGFISDTAREDKIRSIVNRHRDNSVLRAQQVDSIAQIIAHTRTRRLVCGDFNDTPMSYVYRRMAHDMDDAFSECGLGYAHTFRGFFNTLRIDYILSSDGLETLSYKVIEVDYSDHHPVVVQLRKNARTN